MYKPIFTEGFFDPSTSERIFSNFSESYSGSDGDIIVLKVKFLMMEDKH